MKRLLSLILASAPLMLGQVTTPTAPKPVLAAKPGDVIKMLQVKQDAYQRIYSALTSLYPAGSGVAFTFDGSTTSIVVRGPSSTVRLIEETVAKLDAATPANAVPAANVEVTIQLLYGSAKEDPKGNVPTDLQSTVQQLRTVFPYASYRVMDTLLMRGRDGQVMEDSGTLPGSTTIYSVRYTPNVGGTTVRSVRMRGLSLNMRGGSGNNVGMQTDIDAIVGQKTVVGKSNVQGTEDAIFLVVSPKVIP